MYSFWGNDTFPIQVYERKFKSEYLERQFYERLRKSEPSIEKLIEKYEERLIKVIHIECTLGTRGFSCAVSGVGYVSIVTRATFSYFLIKNALLYHFLANWLAHNKMTDKSVFGEAWSPELKSQSFPVSFFGCRGFVPHRKWNLMLLAHQNTVKENRYRKTFLATLISTLGRFNRANKKKSVTNTLNLFPFASTETTVAPIGKKWQFF